MVPVAVDHELRDNSAQQKRFLTNTLGGSGIYWIIIIIVVLLLFIIYM